MSAQVHRPKMSPQATLTQKRIGGAAHADAFISYSREDADDIDWVVSQLTAHGIECFYDKQINPGEDWITKVTEAIIASKSFIIFIRKKPTSVHLQEYRIAETQYIKGKPPLIIPVLLPNAESKAAFLENNDLRVIQRINALYFNYTTRDPEKVGQLARAITRDPRVPISELAFARPDARPSGFKADVGRIADILIGQSVYSTHTVCVRELVQNARDACSRRRHKLGKEPRDPQIVVKLDPKSSFFDVIDYGDGMSRLQLSDSFAVLGRSLNDPYHVEGADQTVDIAVLGKFGVGFVSTFMVAERITISTKHDDDEAHHFSIKDVRSPFEYTNESQCGRDSTDTGTTVRVHLLSRYRQGLQRLDIEREVRHYCRHVPELFVSLDTENKSSVVSDWNCPSASIIRSSIKGKEFEFRIAWAADGFDSIKLSNGGFYVADLGANVLGDFPRGFITGEIDIAPGLVDLVMSRDNLVQNHKMEQLRRLIADGIKQLVADSKDALEADLLNAEHAAKLSIELRRASTILQNFAQAGKMGLIQLKLDVEPRSLHTLAVLNYLGNVGEAKTRGWTRKDIRDRLVSQRLALILVREFAQDYEKLFSDGEVSASYVSMIPMQYTVQMLERQVRVQELKPTGLKVMLPYEAYERFYAWYTPRGILHRVSRWVR